MSRKWWNKICCFFGFHTWVKTRTANPKSFEMKSGATSVIYDEYSRCVNCTAEQLCVKTAPVEKFQ